jgi:hypothetical protein
VVTGVSAEGGGGVRVVSSAAARMQRDGGQGCCRGCHRHRPLDACVSFRGKCTRQREPHARPRPRTKVVPGTDVVDGPKGLHARKL